MKSYDCIVIGSGGGAKIVSPAARLGRKMAVVEKDALGGTCLNRGCIPSKMLIYPASLAASVRGMRRLGLTLNGRLEADFGGIIRRINTTVRHDSLAIAAGYEENPNIDHYHGTARFLDNHTVDVDGVRLTAPLIVLAVGSRPRIPDIPGLNGTPFMTSTEALRCEHRPSKLLVIGAGYIASELGFAYAALGSEVVFFVRSRFLNHEDGDVAREFERVFTRHHRCCYGTPIRIEHREGIFTVYWRDRDGIERSEQGDGLLVATGVVPNTDLLDLQKTDVAIDERGFIRVNDYLQTTVPHIYALGDCIGRYLFRHAVNFEGEYLFRSLFLDESPQPIRYPPMPHAVFTHPEIAAVGETEQQLKEKRVDHVCVIHPYEKSAFGMAMMADHGFVKLLVEPSTRRVLGCHIIGEQAADLLHLVIGVMTWNKTVDEALDLIYIHPAKSEIVRNAFRRARAACERRRPVGQPAV